MRAGRTTVICFEDIQLNYPATKVATMCSLHITKMRHRLIVARKRTGYRNCEGQWEIQPFSGTQAEK
ncbi:hypothetical protein KIN20_033438 [Parelaphostrongylus tenuis]|uniref:Uncharacterized protein n=1 Tax=Parelaphostrongylus tenuis TaxID=148309 RepID=A0AAD5R8E1_PARTN|nr:hypothetical protein KIN20_033438 [Parelaphostrongylus tenuis]